MSDPAPTSATLLRANGVPRRARIAVTAAYAAQGLGYAVVVTSLPAFKLQQGIDDTVVSIIILGVCLTAALGSVVANAVAVRRGSRTALALGLGIQAAAFLAILAGAPFPLFAAAFALYGIGLGCVDAASAMQGVLVQRAYGRSLLGGLFAAYTAAAMAGALLASWVAASALPVSFVIAVALIVAIGVAFAGARLFAPEIPIDQALAPAERTKLPRAGIWAFGLVILAAFVVDSGVSTWSTVYLHDHVGAAGWAAPLGYAAYQFVILVSRLATDRLLPLAGRRRMITIAVIVSVIGCLVVAILPLPAAAVAGFALAGVAVGVLVPVTFGAAGELDPAHSDQIIARVNIFNYAGAVLGAVVIGLLADWPGLGPAFVLPAIALAAVLLVVPRFRTTASAAARGAGPDDAASDPRR
ncbi:MFS transporter [Microbacterium sp. BWT-B31]|uniref:MFS transporter n=1 Tax=Microbacterium sp. BWT-B31 TaxID=3232072 RepID=UPI003527EB06